MSSLMQIAGFPPPEQRDSVRFHFLKNLSYDARMYLFAFALFLGLLLQILFFSPWPGIPFILVAVALALVKGYDSRVRLKYFSPDVTWTQVDIEKIAEMKKLSRKTKKWDRDLLDISNAAGFFILFLIAAAGAFLVFALATFLNSTQAAWIVGCDLLLIIVPMWFSGMKLILKQANLDTRVDIILEMHNLFENIKDEGEVFKPQIRLSRNQENESVPTDARFSIHFPDMPSGFYGLQAQININLVQGHGYPYFYCVLAAKPGFNIRSYTSQIRLSNKVICEYQQDEQAEVLVIRQHTTKKTGYHTGKKQRAAILMNALEGGRMILAEKK